MHEEFMEGLRDSSGIEDTDQAELQYRLWLERERFSEVARIDLEAGGYHAGLEIGNLIKEAR